MARCMKNEKQGHFVFYGAMVAEGIIALIWAAAGCALYEVCLLYTSTLEKNDTHAVISGNTLSFGDQDGTMTLICAAVNADTNVIVEKRLSFASQTPPPAAARPAAEVEEAAAEASPFPPPRSRPASMSTAPSPYLPSLPPRATL